MKRICRSKRPGGAVSYIALLLGLSLYASMPFMSGLEAQSGGAGTRINPDEILLLFSYDALDNWSMSVLEGILATLPRHQGVQYHLEYLDTRNDVSREYLMILEGSILKKHGGNLPALIIAADDAAFSFARDVREQLDPRIPLVFCGVNNAQAEMWDHDPTVVGVEERIDIGATINGAVSLFPETRKLVVIASSEGVGAINLEIFHRQYGDISPGLTIFELIDKDTGELSSLLPNLKEDTLVLRLDNVKNETGQPLGLADTMNFLSTTSPRPVLTCWDFDLGEGALGGMVVNGYQQGAVASELAAAILDGVPPEELPAVRESPNVMMYDYNQLKRFQVPRSRIPAEALVINRPETFFRQYRALIIGALSVMALLIILLGALTFNLLGRRKAERALKKSEERLRLAMEASNDGLWDWDLEANTLYWSPRAYTMLGYEVNQFPVDFQMWKELIHPEDRDSAAATVLHSIEEGRGNFEMEFRYRNSAGEYQWIAGKGKIVDWDEDGRVRRVTGTHVDISARKKSEEALQHSLREKEVLLRELYHRTKNNMQVVASLLSLRRSTMDEGETAEILRNLETKVFTMGMVHQMLYQSKNLDRIDLGEYIREICTLTSNAYSGAAGTISLHYRMEQLEVGLDTAIPLGLVVNELFTNAVKYAFDQEKGGRIDVTLEKRGRLEIRDNGKGIACREEDLYLGHSLGMPTVKELVEHQLDGTISCGTAPGEGTRWEIEFPVHGVRSL